MSPSPRSRAWLAPLAAGAAVALAITALAPGHGSRSPAAAARTPGAPAAAPAATTTTVPPVPHVGRWDTTIATAVGPSVEAFADRPPAATPVDPRSIRADAVAVQVRLRQQQEAGWAPYSTGPVKTEIPSPGQPVEGRTRTATGWVFSNPSGWGGPLTFTVTEDHGPWLRVLLPVRPDGTEGWIKAADVSLTHTEYHVLVDVGARTLTVFDGDLQLLATPIVVGKDATPTPRGRFFITDSVANPPGSSHGAWSLPLSAYSQVLDQFDGGAPVVAIHGTNQPQLAGTAASNGCMRVPSDATITEIRNLVPQGTPVDITH